MERVEIGSRGIDNRYCVYVGTERREGGGGGRRKILCTTLRTTSVCVRGCARARAYGINGDSGSVSLFDRVENFSHRFAIILDARTPFQ